MQHAQTALRRLAFALMLALVAGVRTVAAETVSIQWDPNPEPEVIGYRVFMGAQPGVYTSQVDVGNVTTYNIGNLQVGQRYCFAVAAFFAGPTVGSKSVEVCTDANKPPTLQSPGNQSTAVGATVALTLAGADPEGLPITYSATGLPTGLSLNPNTGFISGTATTVATSNVTVTVSDSVLSTSQAFTWTVMASAPSAATPLRPSGTIATQTPTFEWESVSTATSYRLWVDDASTTDPKVQIDLTPTQAGCTTAGAVCHLSPGVLLQVGKGAWSVRTANASGVGPWSGALDFTVADSKAPVLSIVAPTSASTFTATGSSVALSGTAVDDAGVSQVTWTNNLGGSGTATGTSAWAAAAVPLKVGSNVITVTARDLTGNVATKVLTVAKSDSQVPVLAILSPSPTTPYSTSATSLALTGSASDDGSVTQVTWLSDRGGSGIASGTTAWSIPAIALKTGANVVAVTAYDAAGNKTTKNFTATLTDATAPVVTIATPTSAATYATGNETVAIGGTASDATGVTQITWVNDKGGSGTASGTSAWAVPAVALKPGANVITVTARDAAGNTSTDSITVSLTDGAAPVVTVTSPSASSAFSTTTATIALGGTASDAFGVTQVTWSNSKGGTGTAAGTTSWSVASVPLVMGVNVITITAKDAAGHAGTDTISVTRSDGTPPTIAITAPAANTVTNGAAVNLSGTARDDIGVAEVTWTNNRGGSGVATGTTSWSIANAALQAGVNVFTVVAQDAAGNRTAASVTLTRDSQAPAVSIVTPGAATFFTSKMTVVVAGKATDDTGVKQVTWVSSRGGSGTATGTTDWTVSIPLEAGVANRIAIVAKDGSGNVGNATVTVYVDTRAPVISIVTPTRGSSFNTTEAGVVLGGTANDDFGLAEVTWASSAGTSGVAAGSSTWSTPRIGLSSGVNAVIVTARDKAGNVASATLKVTVRDAQAPRLRILVPTAESSFTTASAAINLGGEASDDAGLARIAWANDRGGSGVVTPNNRWTAGSVALQEGVNVITVTATDTGGNVATDVLRVTYERGAPKIALTSPTTAAAYATSSPIVALTGVASDDGGVVRVKWTSDKGQSGDAVGTTAWSIPSVTVPLGTTVLTVTAYDNTGNTSSVSLAVVYADTTKPAVKIYTPSTGSSVTTRSTSVTVAGTAIDNMGITQVTWSTDRGETGTAFGTTSWSTPSLALVRGTTVITITARDAAGNTGVAVISLTSSPLTSTTSTSTSTIP